MLACCEIWFALLASQRSVAAADAALVLLKISSLPRCCSVDSQDEGGDDGADDGPEETSTSSSSRPVRILGFVRGCALCLSFRNWASTCLNVGSVRVVSRVTLLCLPSPVPHARALLCRLPASH
jgi:hypothetical protein